MDLIMISKSVIFLLIILAFYLFTLLIPGYCNYVIKLSKRLNVLNTVIALLIVILVIIILYVCILI